jgi:ribonuclease BN (tRNA processing enzyme)
VAISICRAVSAIVVLCAVMTFVPGDAATQAPQSRTQVVLLGTGNPGPSPDRSGPATAIVVNGRAYLVDLGPGVVRRAAAAQQKGISALNPINIQHAFVTHLHSDHTIGYPELDLHALGDRP